VTLADEALENAFDRRRLDSSQDEIEVFGQRFAYAKRSVVGDDPGGVARLRFFADDHDLVLSHAWECRTQGVASVGRDVERRYALAPSGAYPDAYLKR
jgi:hypothetical protein